MGRRGVCHLNEKFKLHMCSLNFEMCNLKNMCNLLKTRDLKTKSGFKLHFNKNILCAV